MNTANPVREPIVYVVQQQPFDYSPATAFGELQFMDSKKLAPASPGAPDRWNANVINQIRKDLSGYIPDIDLIIPTGAPARIMAVGMVLAEKGKRHRLLGWDAHTQRYLEFIINL